MVPASRGFGFDQPVVAVLPPVDHAQALALGVAEDEELVVGEVDLHDRFLDGHGLGGNASGADDLRHAAIVDSIRRQHLEPQPGQRPINFPYKVSLTDPEVFMIFGNTSRCDCRWTAKLRWQSGDEDGTTTIRDGDDPFRTASGSAARDQL